MICLYVLVMQEEVARPEPTSIRPNRREYPRFEVDSPVELVVGDPETHPMHGWLRNISRGGVLVRVQHRAEAGSRCVVRFVGSARRYFDTETAVGNVRRAVCGDDGVLLGIEFDTPLRALAQLDDRRTA